MTLKEKYPEHYNFNRFLRLEYKDIYYFSEKTGSLVKFIEQNTPELKDLRENFITSSLETPFWSSVKNVEIETFEKLLSLWILQNS